MGRWRPLATAAGVAVTVAAVGGLALGGRLGPPTVAAPVHDTAPKPPGPTLGVDPMYVPTDAQNGIADSASRRAHLKRTQ